MYATNHPKWETLDKQKLLEHLYLPDRYNRQPYTKQINIAVFTRSTFSVVLPNATTVWSGRAGFHVRQCFHVPFTWFPPNFASVTWSQVSDVDKKLSVCGSVVELNLGTVWRFRLFGSLPATSMLEYQQALCLLLPLFTSRVATNTTIVCITKRGIVLWYNENIEYGVLSVTGDGAVCRGQTGRKPIKRKALMYLISRLMADTCA